MRYLFIPELNLQLFADGGAASAGDGGAGEGNAAVNAEVAAPRKGVKEDLSAVKYGKQTETAPAAEEAKATSADEGKDETAPVDRKAAFKALIEGEYKDLYGESVQATVKARLRTSKQAEAKLSEITPILETLAAKYDVDPTDIKALSKAIEDDDIYYADEAMETGNTIEEIKAKRKMKRENAMLRAEIEKRDKRDNASRQYAVWQEQAKGVAEYYPSFSLEAELANPRFTDLLKANIDMKTAFEVLHQDELIPAAMQYAAKAASKQAASKIAANAARPVENGTAPASAAHVKDDVSKLTKADRAEINRRVMRGDKITFTR